MKVLLLIFLLIIPSVEAIKHSELVKQTKERMKVEPYRFSIKTMFNRKYYNLVKTVVKGEELLVIKDENDVEIVRLYIKNGFWYIYENKSTGWQKFRPFEATPKFPYFYFSLRSFDSIFVYKKDIDVTSDQTFYDPLDKMTETNFKNNLEYLKKSGDKRFTESIKTYEHILSQGLIRKIDPQTGTFLLKGSWTYIEKSSLKWIKNEKIRKAPPEVSKDFSSTPKLKDPIFIRYNFGEKRHYNLMPDFCYLDLATKERRRFPINGRIASAHFINNKDSSIYLNDGSLYSLNLKTLKKDVLLKLGGKGDRISFSPVSNKGNMVLITLFSPEPNKQMEYSLNYMKNGLSGEEDMYFLDLKTKKLTPAPELKKLSVTAWAKDDKSFLTTINNKVFNVALDGTKTEITEGKVIGYFSEEEILLEMRTGSGPIRLQTKYFELYNIKSKSREKLPITFSENSCSVAVDPFKERVLILERSREITYPLIWKRGDSKPTRISNEKGIWSLPRF